jgi:uncharacterized protein (UPF0332 family)
MSSAALTIAGYMRKAERALDEARLLLREQKTEGACSRAYYNVARRSTRRFARDRP